MMIKKNKLSAYFTRNSKTFAHLAKAIQKRPSKENVHQIRIAIRRLRSVLALTGNKSKHQQLRKLAQLLGKQRDLDVAIVNAKKFGLNHRKLKVRQTKQRTITKNALTIKKIRQFKKELGSVPQTIKAIPPLKLQASLAAKLNQLYSLKYQKLNAKDLHRTRLLIKEVRYLQEAMGQSTMQLRKLQTLLGEINDLEVLQHKLGKHPKLKKAKAAYLKRIPDAINLLVADLSTRPTKR